jgi:hypothetical protein
MSTSALDHFLNPELLKLAEASFGFNKRAFVPAADPSMGAGGDPAAAAGGGGAPPDPGMAGGAGGGGDPGAAFSAPPSQGPDATQQMLQQMMQMMQQMQGGGGAGGSGAAMKPKIDVNVEIMKIENMLAKICDALNIQIPAQDMVGTADKLMAMSQGQSVTSPAGTGQGGGGAAGGGGQAIPPVGPMQPAGTPGGPAKTARLSYGGGYAPSGAELDVLQGQTTDFTNRIDALMMLAGQKRE